jgi:hypothetical protein
MPKNKVQVALAQLGIPATRTRADGSSLPRDQGAVTLRTGAVAAQPVGDGVHRHQAAVRTDGHRQFAVAIGGRVGSFAPVAPPRSHNPVQDVQVRLAFLRAGGDNVDDFLHRWPELAAPHGQLAGPLVE